jgi:hypothetical protein
MNQHDHIQHLLVFPDELTSNQRAEIRTHLTGCAACREAAELMETNRVRLSSLRPAAAPPILRNRVFADLPRADLPRRRLTPHVGHVALGALLCVAALAGSIFGLVMQQSATPANAFTMMRRAATLTAAPYPYTGSARITYSRTPWYLLPPQVARYAGHYTIDSRWWVRDAGHFRIDVRILSPVLERGTIVAVLNGQELTTYDSRTARATFISQAGLSRLRLTAPELLAFLQNGGQFNDMYNPTPIGRNTSMQHYLTELTSVAHRLGVRSYARIVKQTTMLGFPVDVVQFGPLGVKSYDSTGCFPTTTGGPGRNTVVHPPAGPCNHYRQSVGWARVVIRRDAPIVLRFEEHGINSIENVLMDSVNYRYQVRRLHDRASVSDAVLAYKPPVPVTRLHAPESIILPVSTYQGNEEEVPAPFASMPEPYAGAMSAYSLLATTYFGMHQEPSSTFRPNPPVLPTVPGVDLLFAQHPRWTKVYSHWHGQASIYVTGHYVLVQQRLLAAGLPKRFTAGSPATAGTCHAWTGTYGAGQRWIAFRRGRVSVIVSSNALTRRALISYVSRDGPCS